MEEELDTTNADGVAQGSTPADIAAALLRRRTPGDPAETANPSELLSIERMVEQTVRVYQEAIQNA